MKKTLMRGAEPQYSDAQLAVAPKVIEVVEADEGFHRTRIRPSPNLLKALRKALDLTQHQMGLLLGIHSTHVGSLEAGRKPITKSVHDRIKDLARYVDRHNGISVEHYEILVNDLERIEEQKAVRKAQSAAVARETAAAAAANGLPITPPKAPRGLRQGAVPSGIRPEGGIPKVAVPRGITTGQVVAQIIAATVTGIGIGVALSHYLI